ncbi:hypothetical protein IHN63_00160 [Deinococcus sp. 6YEL10]|uniref:hypothetical protein n=1 Tax=Deinococcus sp. 6YEL10 TaxID=2745870 RepID=UPI001E5A3ABD|nr:hypothetical protein [Deinococcus sp. 6YEL10]MCD0159711.1 hypothetical protein [Deinococcus sp. 6YEL10]
MMPPTELLRVAVTRAAMPGCSDQKLLLALADAVRSSRVVYRLMEFDADLGLFASPEEAKKAARRERVTLVDGDGNRSSYPAYPADLKWRDYPVSKPRKGRVVSSAVGASGLMIVMEVIKGEKMAEQADVVWVRASGGDWEGVYVNGVLKRQNHSVDWVAVISELVGKELRSVVTWWVEDEVAANLPDALKGIDAYVVES